MRCNNYFFFCKLRLACDWFEAKSKLASDRVRTHTETEGRCFAHSDAFSSEIHSASCELKENHETQREERHIIFFFSWSIFRGSLASLGIHEYTVPHSITHYLGLKTQDTVNTKYHLYSNSYFVLLPLSHLLSLYVPCLTGQVNGNITWKHVASLSFFFSLPCLWIPSFIEMTHYCLTSVSGLKSIEGNCCRPLLSLFLQGFCKQIVSVLVVDS